MKQCLSCRGLVPEALEACPNCAVDRRSGRSLLKVAGLVALVASGCQRCGEETIPVPVYGAPPPPPAQKAKKLTPELIPPAEDKADGGSP